MHARDGPTVLLEIFLALRHSVGSGTVVDKRQPHVQFNTYEIYQLCVQ